MKVTRKLMGVGLVLVLLVSMLVMAVPVSAGTLSWSAKTGSAIPSTTNKIVQDGTSLRDMAVSADGQTIFVAAGANGIYKSTNGGDTWSALSIPSAITGNVTMVAVAPDDPDVVVFVGNTTGLTTNLKAYVSTNGGSTWNSLGTIQDAGGTAAAQIYDVAISPLSAGVRYIACAGTEAANQPAIYYFNLGATTPVWKDACDDFTTAFVPGGIDNFRAVAFSPNFPSDQVMVAVSEEIGAGSATGTVRFHIASFNQKKWDANVFTGYPVTLESASGLSVNAADIALDPEYLAGDDASRIAFTGLSASDNTSTEVGGIYRLKNTSLKELKAATAVNSVAWDGTNLAAGAYDSNNVYRCADALASSPTVSTSRSYKEISVDDPDNNDQVVVKWGSSGTLLGIKQYHSSAFGRSTDNGKTWNDIALVDMTLNSMEDLWVSPDGSVTYLLAVDTTDNVTSLWRKASAWTRVFSIYNNDTAPAGYIVRAAASNPDVVYIADDGNGATTMYYSTTGGTEKWVVRASRYDIADLAVQDADIAYVANYDNDEVSKTTNGGFTWGADVDSKAGGGNCATLTLLADDQLLLGTTTGYVSYSSDGNGSWTKISTQLNVAGSTQVTATGLASGDYIFASTNGTTPRVERWQIGQSSTSWKNLAAPVPTGDKCYGLLYNDGVLYAVTANATGSSLLRTLDPTTATPGASKWVKVTSTGVYNTQPSALRLSTGSTTLWAVDTSAAPDALHSFTDTLATGVEIELVSPVAGYENPVNPVTGKTQDISFKWNKPESGSVAVAYQVRIKGPDGATTLLTATKSATDSSSPSLLIGPDQTTNTLNFTPGQTYYWQVRATSPVDSPWSPLRAFTIAALPEAAPPVIVTEAPAPTITAPAPVTITQVPAPQITVTAPAPPPATTITIPAAPAAPAPITPAFIWAIIIIGAVLVIAVIVLIVRTRRTV